MTTATFDPRTAKDIAAGILARGLTVEEELDREFDALVEQCLDALGTDPAGIAAGLARYKIKGTRPDSYDNGDGETEGDLVDHQGNALAVYFRDVCGAASASVSTYGATISWNGPDGSQYGNESYQLPPAAAQFMRAYEAFQHPDLMLEGAGGEPAVKMVPMGPDPAQFLAAL